MTKESVDTTWTHAPVLVSSQNQVPLTSKNMSHDHKYHKGMLSRSTTTGGKNVKIKTMRAYL